MRTTLIAVVLLALGLLAGPGRAAVVRRARGVRRAEVAVVLLAISRGVIK